MSTATKTTRVNLGVEKDHIESLTRSSGLNALAELIWNSLDADSTKVTITTKSNSLGHFSEIKVKDNGHGISYDDAKKVFSKLGGSVKKINSESPRGRHYHGKLGKGRYKSLALGDLMIFKSTYLENGSVLFFRIIVDRNNITYSQFEDSMTLSKSSRTGVEVVIRNINNETAIEALSVNSMRELEQKFASYYISYPDFEIKINGKLLQFESLIKNTENNEFELEIDENKVTFIIRIVEWIFDIKKKTYLCNLKGVPFGELNLGIRSSVPISIFIQSKYVEKLHKSNLLDLGSLNENVQAVYEEARKLGREYVRKRLHIYSGEFISELKQKGIYPYKNEAESVVEESQRQVFDIVALQVNEYLPDFERQDERSKKFTLSLIKEALEKDATSLQRILTEVIELPEDKREELVEILEETSLSNIIDTMTEIKNRLKFLNGLEEIIYNKKLNKNILERKHLHKIIINETWIFGDEFTYGVDDSTLKNVLKNYLQYLGREDFEEVIDQSDNDKLQVIPDVCLWKQFSLGKPGEKRNLVIELKRPSKDAGIDELSQIKTYATRVSKDKRFPKSKTKWVFMLITKDVKDEIELDLDQSDRKYGHIITKDNIDVFVLTWGEVINEAKTRYEFIKEKLNLNLIDNEKNLDYLRSKYKEYLPQDI